MSRTALIITTGILIPLAALTWFAGGLAVFAFNPAQPDRTDAVVFEVSRGQSPWEVARALQSKGLVSDAKSLHRLGRLTRQWEKMKAGEYEVRASFTPIEILAVVTSGVSLQYPVTVREGMNLYEIADALVERRIGTREKIVALCADARFIATTGLPEPLPPSLEGYLFPDTYSVNRSMSPEDVLRMMVRRFLAVWRPEWDAKAKALGLTRHQAVTFASIVEKETGAPQERPMIASVFHNRLRKRMRLQSDPTTIYGMWHRYTGNIRKSDLLEATPYNTYAIPALPVGPISNPGKEALAATLEPATSDFLFFVSRNDGTHEFTRTFADHQEAVRKFQLNAAARAGKSWRDLKRTAAGSP